jgi:hypothetical protein
MKFLSSKIKTTSRCINVSNTQSSMCEFARGERVYGGRGE